MIISMMGNQATIEIPAGRYWFGDPCYALSDARYAGVLVKGYTPVRHLDGLGGYGLIGETKQGDGRFKSRRGEHEFPVDSGQLSILHEGMIDADTSDGLYVDLPKSTEVTFQNGFFKIGDVLLVDTDEQEDPRF